MKALTIRQPWASLIACGFKTIETRSWSTRYRDRIAIHAGARPIGCEEADLALRYLGHLTPPRRAIVATAVLTDVQKVGHLSGDLTCTTPAERRPIPSCPGYAVDMLGNIYREDGLSRILIPQEHAGRYPEVSLRVDGERRPRRVHTLVAEAWLAPVPGAKLIRHFDGNRYNNAAWNLRRGTHGKNLVDAYRLGERGAPPTLRPQEGLSNAELIEIHRLADERVSVTEIARRVGRSRSAVGQALGRWAKPNKPTRPEVDDSLAESLWAWLLDDVKPTTERCPGCWGEQVIDDQERPGHRRPCPTCRVRDGHHDRPAGRCGPVPARGRQGLFNIDFEGQ